MFRKQPKIDVKPNETDHLLMRIGSVLLLLHFILVGVFYIDLPESIPTHFNLKGKADGFGDKSSVWALPIISTILYFGLSKMTTKIKTWQYNYPTKVTEQNAPYLYALSIQMLARINIGSVLIFFIISLHTILIAKGMKVLDLGYLLPVLFIGMTLYPFFVIYKMFNIPKS